MAAFVLVPSVSSISSDDEPFGKYPENERNPSFKKIKYVI